MADSQKPEQFNHRLLEWVQDRLSLKNLRKGNSYFPYVHVLIDVFM